ncbi:PREDICTED: inositol 1,4,5-trisphosphate receptor-interacting protein-like 1 [Corvus brachyrhynchos]|uniref:inositol 1,4,5-trisphosphate receptor-interacting protein-like 1 n=1 Tax=Corvus brachyrhynchos TaxID=85066 RepID=UPI0008164937|nr:PREDICTED: inositol 1,4,5-trisphosphate receptor-interacting protein-like 1 [Corvus brachyrhynchos]
MVTITFLLLLLQGLIQYPREAGDGLDEATRECMKQRAEYLDQEMTRLIQELEQKTPEQSGGSWGALPVWQFWAVLGILVLLLALWFGLKNIRCDPDNSGQKERTSSNLEEEEEGNNVVAKKEIESNDANVEEDNNDGNEEGSNVDAKRESNVGNEQKEGYDDANEEVNNDEKVEEVNAVGNEDRHNANEEDDAHNVKSNLGSLLEEFMQLPVLDLDKSCSLVTDPMDKLTHIFGQGLSNSFYPVPQQAIGVGSAFEGWSPQAEDVVYRVLVPLSPPPGHAFHLELDTAGMPQRNFYVHVELLCTCTREHLGENLLCFLHHPEEELRRKHGPSLLHTLCTGSYLDVEKTVHWFYQFMRVAWLLLFYAQRLSLLCFSGSKPDHNILPQTCHWRLMLQPSGRSCKFQLSKDKESFMVEMNFGVRQGDSDIFVGSQPTEAGIPSTTWLETYAVAEAKFFRHISRQAPHDSWHCKCLPLLTRILVGVGFSSYSLKTVVMHLLSTVPLTQWRRRDFWQRLVDILKYLRCSLETKQLNCFVVGNERFPMEISFPSEFCVAEPLNLFQHLASNPDAHMKARREYIHLLQRLKQLLICGH